MFSFYGFVAAESYPPDLDACIAEDLQGGPDIRLELVLHSSQTQQLHLHLQTLNHCCHLQRAVMDTQLGLDVTCLRSRRGTGMFWVGGDQNSIRWKHCKTKQGKQPGIDGERIKQLKQGLPTVCTHEQIFCHLQRLNFVQHDNTPFATYRSLHIGYQSFSLNTNYKVFACKQPLELLCFRELKIQNRHDQLVNAHRQCSSSRAICEWDKAKTIWVWLIQEHKLCVWLSRWLTAAHQLCSHNYTLQ